MQYIIGVDIGTSGTKAVALAFSGEVLADAQISYTALLPQPGYHELDPEILFEAVIKTIKEVSDKTGDGAELSGISFSTAMHSLIVMDKNDLPLTNAITWADSRSKEQAIRIKNSAVGDNIYANTGTPIHSMSPLCKISWFREKNPLVFNKAFKFIGIKEFIWFRFFGKYIIDYSIASATGLFDIYRFNWFEEALALVGISADKLSDPKPTVYMEWAIRGDYGAAMGISKKIPFIIGGSDGCLANLGSNAILAGDASLTIGTSGALRMISEKPKHDPKQRIFNYILTENRYVSGGAVNNGAVILQWFVENFMKPADGTGPSFAERIAGAGLIPAGSDGLLFLPYLLGERAPIWDEDARGVFFGIHPKHTVVHFLRAVMEGISFSLYQVGLSLEETIGPIKDIYVSGGFIQSPCWLQLIADLFNKKVFVTNAADASAIGAAMLGFFATGVTDKIEGLQKMVKITRVIQPDTDQNQVYKKYYPLFSSLYDAVRGEFTSLNILRTETNLSG
jgi:gluconokinase